MLHVTREGVVTGSYWDDIRKVERERVGIYLKQKEDKDRSNYINAMKAATIISDIPKPPESKVKGRQKRKPSPKTKLSLYDIHGDKAEKLYVDGFTIKQIADELNIKYVTAQKILNKRSREAMKFLRDHSL